MPSEREVSLSNNFNQMTLDENKKEARENQVNSEPDADPPASNLPLPTTTPKKGENLPPQTPQHPRAKIQNSQVPTETPSMTGVFEGLERSVKALVPTRYAPSPSPTKASFLHRNSNLTNFIVNDIDEKVGRMNNELVKFKEFMESTERNSVTVKEELELSKKRGKGHNYGRGSFHQLVSLTGCSDCSGGREKPIAIG